MAIFYGGNGSVERFLTEAWPDKWERDGDVTRQLVTQNVLFVLHLTIVTSLLQTLLIDNHVIIMYEHDLISIPHPENSQDSPPPTNHQSFHRHLTRFIYVFPQLWFRR